MSNNELLNMKRKALMLGLCGEYKKKWDSCTSKKELMDLVLDSNGVEFLADAITFGWGCSQEFLLNEFADFINGRYQRKKDGYTSELYVHHNEHDYACRWRRGGYCYSRRFYRQSLHLWWLAHDIRQ